MIRPIRLGCHQCDREDFDGIEKIPPNWLDVAWVQSLEDSLRELESSDPSGNVFEWYTHLGTCPECQAEEK
jgi:hypothetical protein